jgi:hypothetical protein
LSSPDEVDDEPLLIVSTSCPTLAKLYVVRRQVQFAF